MGWVQVKCDLRLLSQFPFILNPDWELPASKKSVNRLPLKEGVRDMLVKHHLFSCDFDFSQPAFYLWFHIYLIIYLTLDMFELLTSRTQNLRCLNKPYKCFNIVP